MTWGVIVVAGLKCFACHIHSETSPLEGARVSRAMWHSVVISNHGVPTRHHTYHRNAGTWHTSYLHFEEQIFTIIPMFIHTDTGNLNPLIFLVLKNPRVIDPDLRKILCHLFAQQYRINPQCKMELGCDPWSVHPLQILACEIPLTEDPGRLQPMGSQKCQA